MEFFDEEYIIDELNKGNETAIRTIFTEYYPRLFAFVNKFVKDIDDVKDILQEIFINLYDTRGRYQMTTLRPLLFTMARNACINYVRHKWFTGIRLDDDYKEKLYAADFGEDENYEFVLDELRRRVDELVDKLPERTREAYLMFYKERMTNIEIAETMNISVRMVDRHLRQAIAFIKEHTKLTTPIIAIIMLLNS